MKISLKNKSRVAILLTGMYIFLAFFAVHLHRHNTVDVIKDFQFQEVQSELLFDDTHAAEFSDCLSCHLHYLSKLLIPNEFSCDFVAGLYFTKQIYTWKQRFSGVAFQTLYLRGPPQFFV